MDKQNAGTGSSSAPPVALRWLTAILTLGFTPLAVWVCRQAWEDWHSLPADGVVIQARVERIDPPRPRARGPWQVAWLIECDPAGPGTVWVAAPGTYRSAAEAETAARPVPGRRVTVWYVPWLDGGVELDQPDWRRGLCGACWTSTMAAIGWLGVAAFVQLGWRRWRHSGAKEA